MSKHGRRDAYANRLQALDRAIGTLIRENAVGHISAAQLANWLQADLTLLRQMRADIAQREPLGDSLAVHPPVDLLLRAVDRAIDEKQAALDALRGTAV